MSARRLPPISRSGRRWVLLLARCLTALVILGGVVFVSSGSVLAQEPGPRGPAPGADAPIDAGIDRSRFEPFRKALDGVRDLEQEVEWRTRYFVYAEERLRAAEQGLSEQSLETARSYVNYWRGELTDKRSELEAARKKLEEERQKLSPDDRIDLAIVNLAERLGGELLDAFLAAPTVYRTVEETYDAQKDYDDPRVPALTELEDAVACWLAVAHLGPALREGGASGDALERWEEARKKAWKIMTARVDAIREKLRQTDLFQKGYDFMHAVYHRALAKGDHEQRAAGLAGGDPLIIKFTGPCPGAGCPEEERQKGQTR